MRKIILASAILAACVIGSAAPASAQYRFDPRIDPSECSWRWICDYGGRAIIVHYRRVHRVTGPVLRVRG